jgi:RHS repeat-associated protein
MEVLSLIAKVLAVITGRGGQAVLAPRASQRLMIAVVSGTRPNVFAERFSRQRSGLRAEPVVRAAGGEQLGGTLYELAPRCEGVPLHIHHGMEELAIVISGRPTLRTLEGESELAPGDIVAFPRGRAGGPTLANRTEQPVRYLMVSNKVMPELVEYPEGVATSSGNIWVADTGNNRIQELAGSEFVRKFGGSGSGGGELETPGGVATDSSGDVWVVDTGHDRVQEFNSKGEFVREFGAPGSEHGELYEPRGIAVNAAGDVYVADGSSVKEFSSKGEFIRAIGSLGKGEGQFEYAVGVAVDGEGHVWAVDDFGGLPRVEEFTAVGVFMKQFGAAGKENGQFKEPKGIAVDAKGDVWIADTGNDRVQEFKSSGEWVRTFGSEGTGNGQFKKPIGLAFDSEGDLWVADSGNDRVQRFTSEGSYLSQVGVAGNENGQFNNPEGVATSSGNIWVADTGNNRIQEGQPQSSATTTYGYDQAGDLTAINRPEGESKPKIEDTYAYNGEDLRTSQTISGTTTYMAWNMTEGLPLLLSDGTNSYIYGPGGLPVEQISTGGTTLYLHHDQQGSTRLLTGSTGVKEASMTYDAYGNTTGTTGTATSPLGYDGQYTSTETGLIYLRQRVYDPATGQFLTVDPLDAVTREPYSYASDNPVNSGDPSGLSNWNPFSESFWTEGNVISESSLNPIPDYEAEVSSYENGCGYFASVAHGIEGAVVGALDASGAGEEAAGADAADAAATDGAEVIFGHGARHLVGTALDSGEVESAIRSQVEQSAARASSTGSFWGRTVVDGQTVEYRAYTLPNGSINVGTYYVVP